MFSENSKLYISIYLFYKIYTILLTLFYAYFKKTIYQNPFYCILFSVISKRLNIILDLFLYIQYRPITFLPSINLCQVIYFQTFIFIGILMDDYFQFYFHYGQNNNLINYAFYLTITIFYIQNILNAFGFYSSLINFLCLNAFLIFKFNEYCKFTKLINILNFHKFISWIYFLKKGKIIFIYIFYYG